MSEETTTISEVRTDPTDSTITIGNHVDVIILGLNDNVPINGKVDTGSAQTSLGVDDLEVLPDPLHQDQYRVKFSFNNKNYTMNAHHMQAVTSANGGTKNRPVISVSVRFNSELYQEVEINLSNRDSMPDVLLIGQNLLKLMDIVINPKVDELAATLVPSDTGQPAEPVSPLGALVDNPEPKSEFDLNNELEPGTTIDDSTDPVEEILAILKKHPEITLLQLIQHVTTEALTNYLPQ